MSDAFANNLYLAKLNQIYWWYNPDKKIKHTPKMMCDKEYEKLMKILLHK